jgi:hypothetical protein
MKSGNTDDIKAVLKTWTQTKLWNPPRQDQALQQGGVVIFQGRELLWAHYDPATAAHADLAQVGAAHV